MLRTLIFTAVTFTSFTFFISPAFSQTTNPNNGVTTNGTNAPSNPSGNYTCTGTDASDKTEYVGDLIITQTGDTYNFKWVETKGDKFDGAGIFSKNYNTMLSAAFWSTHGEKKSGIIVYQVQTDGSLVGTWAWAGKNEIGTEICKKQK